MKVYILLILAFLLMMVMQCNAIAFTTKRANNTIMLTEYYDYECPHCRRMAPIIEHLQLTYPNLHIVYRVTPLLTTESRAIASFVLAAKIQKGWSAMHQVLMQSMIKPTLLQAEQIAKRQNLDLHLLLNTMSQADIQKTINFNIKQAQKYAIRGMIYLPIFVFKTFSNNKAPAITLFGEQSYDLLSAVVKQLTKDSHVEI